jgi:hypothetical protein
MILESIDGSVVKSINKPAQDQRRAPSIASARWTPGNAPVKIGGRQRGIAGQCAM